MSKGWRIAPGESISCDNFIIMNNGNSPIYVNYKPKKEEENHEQRKQAKASIAGRRKVTK